MRVFVGSDHAAYELKEHLVKVLAEAGHEPIDCGAHVYDAEDDYPPYCFDVGERVVAEPGSLGVVLGGSGNGEQIAANKVPGIRAALAWNLETAKLARQHNNAQVVAIGAREHSIEDASSFAEAFLAEPFSEDPRHERRIAILDEYEKTHEPPALPDA
jgi:ribose 5-phosphate isomerase B